MLELFLTYFDLNKINIIFTITGVIITLFSVYSSRDYSFKNRDLYYLCNIIYIISFSIIILTNNWILFIIGWEMVTITTFLMLLWGSNKIARVYLIIQFVGSNILIMAVLFIMRAGYATIGPISEPSLQLLLIIGVGVKSAVIGLHFWLPIVHSRAPSPVSAILSGWVVKLGFIILLKTVVEGNLILLYAGIVMVIYAGLKALFSTDYKVLLAYSTISQLGFIAIGIGSGNQYAYWGSVLHIIVHGLTKTSLFLGSGYWVKKVKSRTIYKFQNCWKTDKLNSIFTILGLAGLAGLPLIGGYNSKYLIKYAAGNSILFKYLFHLLSVITYLYVIRLLRWTIFKIKKDNKLINKTKADSSDFFSLSVGSPLILVIAVAFVSSYLVSLNSFDFHLLEGSLHTLIYILVAVIILKAYKWLPVEEKEVPSMDLLLKNTINGYRFVKGKDKSDSLEMDMENYIYSNAIKFASKVYKVMPGTIQGQLLLIPVAILLLLLFL